MKTTRTCYGDPEGRMQRRNQFSAEAFVSGFATTRAGVGGVGDDSESSDVDESSSRSIHSPGHVSHWNCYPLPHTL